MFEHIQFNIGFQNSYIFQCIPTFEVKLIHRSSVTVESSEESCKEISLKGGRGGEGREGGFPIFTFSFPQANLAGNMIRSQKLY